LRFHPFFASVIKIKIALSRAASVAAFAVVAFEVQLAYGAPHQLKNIRWLYPA
jgi:hypothetical protein